MTMYTPIQHSITCNLHHKQFNYHHDSSILFHILQKVEAKSRYFFLDPRLDKSDLSSKEAFKQKGYQLGHVAPMGIALHV